MSLFSAGLVVVVSVLCSMLYKPTTILTVQLYSCYKKDLKLEVEKCKNNDCLSPEEFLKHIHFPHRV